MTSGVSLSTDNVPTCWQVIDSLRDARVEYYVRDFYDNIVFDTVTYTAPTFIDTMAPNWATVQTLFS
ncbi:MAG: hypothetical protein IPI24_12850 [Ignavibacteria bacterium]|nr:hypothetical protein [Ignavibacteria bacterium]